MKTWHKVVFWVVVVLTMIALVGVYIWRLFDLQFANTPDAFGLFGDYVGGVLGAFTGLVSVVFLYFTYKKQLEIFLNQKKRSETQQFEQTFFHLLDNFIVLRQQLNNKAERTEGLAYLRSVRLLIEKYIDAICNQPDAFNDLNTLETRRKIEGVYLTAFNAESDQLGHYFRSLYHLLKYIKGHCPKDENKKMYFDLVQAQMNTDELYLTCINGISSYGRKKLHPLLNDSSFLENLAIDENESIRKLVYFYYPKTKIKSPNGVRKNVILVAGTEGTMKGHLAKLLLSEHIPSRITSIQGMLIRANCDFMELVKNQVTLKKMLDTTIDPDDIYVINCHFCQLNRDGTNELLPMSVYDGIHPIAVVYLESSIEYMINSIRRDDKVIIDETFAQIYQENEETAASDYAALKNVPFYKFSVDNLSKVVDKIRELVAANS